MTTHAQQTDPADWIRANAIRLSTTEAGHGCVDLQPLKALIGNARIVSLGEATHGTREFFQLKHRMLEFLASEMGFTIFSIEANMPEAYRLNNYVLNGTGNPAELLRGMYFWTWNTGEVLDMIRWMRAFNASGRGPVQFTGFDMQTHTVALDIVRQFVRRYDNAYVATVTDASRKIPVKAAPAGARFGVATWSYSVSQVTAPTVDPRASVADWSDAVAHLEAERTSYRARGARDRDIDWAIQNARVVLQAVQRRAGVVSRDRSMALNVKWILDQNPNAKIVLWAHNGHVSRSGTRYRSMGEELHDIYGAQMVVFGFSFNRGSFQAVGARGGGLQNFTVGPAPSASFDALLGAAGIPVFALDLRNAPPSLREQRLSRQIGAMFSNDTESNYNMRASVPSLFDAILFVENTTAARPNVRR